MNHQTDMATHEVNSAPAPWHLEGTGYILLYYFRSHFVEEKGFMTDFQKENMGLTVGAAMLIDYQRAPVGPYQELLFIPGLFNFEGWRSFSVSKIYVSSPESQWNGQRNWGLQKELATFSIQELEQGSSQWTVKSGEQPFFKATLSDRSAGLPFSSRLVPWSRLVQEVKSRLLLTSPTATGSLRLAAANDIVADPAHFPPVQEERLIAAFKFQDFHMKFPVPWHIE